MGRPRKWPGETQAERNLACQQARQERYHRERENRPDGRCNRPSKYPGDTPQERDRARKAAWQKLHAEEVRAHQAEYRKRPEARELMRQRGLRHRAKLTTWDRRIRNLRGKYKLTVEQFNAMMSAQNGKCAICGEVFGLWCMPAVDHCHTTGKVRGILCGFCNRMLGTANDDPEQLSSAIAYLVRPFPELPQEAAYLRREFLPDGQKRSDREKALRSRYRLTLSGYEYLLSIQQNRCRICRKPFGSKRPHVDHDHETHRVRGLLCRVCNTLLGMARDNPSVIQSGIVYLEAHTHGISSGSL